MRRTYTSEAERKELIETMQEILEDYSDFVERIESEIELREYLALRRLAERELEKGH